MEQPQLSQAEIWDDSELVDSWNEALEEYKKYHSLAAKGEKVKLNPESTKNLPVNGDIPQATLKLNPDAVELTEQEDALLETAADAAVESPPPSKVPLPTSATTAPALPQMLLSTVHNEDLKNLMMSWYYAGYYTGLYEGKQQGYASAMQQQTV